MSIPYRTAIGLIAVILFIAPHGGCVSHATRVRHARNAFFAGDLEQSAALLEKANTPFANDRDCLRLDQAMVALVQGRPQEAEHILREVRDHFDHLEQKNLAEEGLALLADDTRRAYPGEDYEKVMIRAFLALANLMHGGEDAGAYCLQVDAKQREIVGRGLPGAEENPKLAYKRVAIGVYLHGVLQEASHQNYDGAERAFATVAAWEPGFTLARVDAERSRNGVHSSRGNGVVYVVVMVGRGPYKEETTADATSVSLLIADRIVTAFAERSLPPTIAPVKIPAIVVPHNVIDGVEVSVNNHIVGVTQTVTDIGQMAWAQHQATIHHTTARAVARRAVKKATVYAAKDVLDVNHPWTNLAFDAAGVIWEATEAADTRGWGLLPETIQVLRVELPAGEHTLALRPASRTRPIGPLRACTVHVEDGRNTYVLAYFPGSRVVGEILTSNDPPEEVLDGR